MADSDAMPQAGEHVEGFLVKAVTPLEALRLTAVQLEHVRSGARVLHLCANDSENLFSISFPTPPPDDTGLPHILEHAALSGSRKYPVRDPFFEMLKMSMATFLNAMTGPDRTYYPVASNVKPDLFNLAGVYFDAVFHPLLSEATFKREGHHLAPASPDGPTGELTVNGIVFNEMKGAFSDPEMRLCRSVSQDLLPDTVYGRESGGDPDHIPELTYDDFLNFHRTYYHPSNAYIILYGDIPTRDYLAFLNPGLDPFGRIAVNPAITRQPRWTEPRSLTDTYPIGPQESGAEKTYVSVNWLVGDAIDPVDSVLFQVLGHFLLGNEGAPLKKAVIDSKLGQDLVYSGYGDVGLEAAFRVGIKGAEPDRTDAFVTLVTETLGRIADRPVERDRIEAAFRQTVYSYREIGPQFPLYTMSWVLEAWPYGADPLTFLRMDEHLAACRARYEADPAIFNRLIRERILENPHRLTVQLRPDRDWQTRTDAAFRERMKDVRARLTREQLAAIATEAEDLEREAGTPNPPEVLATLPQLKIGDLPPSPREIPTSIEQIGAGVTFLRNDVFSNGVNYLHLDLDLAGLPVALWPYVPRYIDAVAKLGAAGMNYEQIARRVAASTGGIACWPCFFTHATDPARPLLSLRFALKALDEQIVPALDLLRDIFFGVDPRDKDRLRDVLVQAQALYRTHLVHEGSLTAVCHASRGLTVEGHLSEIVGGLPQLALTDQLISRFDGVSGDLMDKIEALPDFLGVRNRLAISFTGSDRAAEIVRTALTDWSGRMRPDEVAEAPVGFAPYDAPPREGLAGPVQTTHCARVAPAIHFSHPDEPFLTLGAHIVRFDYLLSEIRLKGNAYGAGCRYDSLAPSIAFSSFRDPHLARTLRVFAGTADYVRRAEWTQTDIERAIIGTAKDGEKPIRPESATKLALTRHRTGLTAAVRRRRYARLLSATPGDVKRALVAWLESGFRQGAVCVVSSRTNLEAANREMPEQVLAIHDMLE